MKCNLCGEQTKKGNVYCMCDGCLLEAVDYAKVRGWKPSTIEVEKWKVIKKNY